MTDEISGTSTASVPDNTKAGGKRRFRVALSFAGAQKAFIEQVAEKLADAFGRGSVFYYPWYEPEINQVGGLALQGPNLYLSHSDLTCPFISEAYVESDACAAEWRAVLQLIYKQQLHRLMLFRFDQTPIAGLFSYDLYSEVGNRIAAEIAELIVARWEFYNGIAVKPGAAPDANRAFEVLRQTVGERVLERLKTPALQKLRTEGGFLAGHEDPADLADVMGLMYSLHRATRKCVRIWASQYTDPFAREDIKRDCRLLLGEILKLGVKRDLAVGKMDELAFTAPDRIDLSCRCVGTAATYFSALRDLPLLFSDVIKGGFDVSNNSVIDLDDLATGVDQDARDDLYNALWRATRGKSLELKTWLPEHRRQLQRDLAKDWNRDRKWYLLTARKSSGDDTNSTYREVAGEMSVGLVIRSAAEHCDLLNIEEEDLVALVCDYLQLLEEL